MTLLERLKYAIIGWQNYKLAAQEQTGEPKDRRVVGATRPLLWPAEMRGLFTKPRNLSATNSKGSSNGIPVQLGHATRTRTVTWGYAEWGQRYRTRIPLPASGRGSGYLVEGYPVPVPTEDRHLVMVHPDGRTVDELIMFDPDAPEWPLSNQALGWGRWIEGELVAGRAVTAAELPLHRYIWTANSAKAPHALALVVADYEGGDGLLKGSPVKCGMWVALDRSSPSYRDMVGLGGECAVIAEALADHGAVLIDRNSYEDVHASRRKSDIGQRPHAPTIHMAPSRDFAATNVHLFTVRLADLVEVVG